MKTLTLKTDIIITRTIDNQIVIITLPAGNYENSINGITAKLAFDFSETILKSETKANKAALAYNNVMNSAERSYQRSMARIDKMESLANNASESLQIEMSKELKEAKTEAKALLDEAFKEATNSVRVTLNLDAGTSLASQAVQLLMESGLVNPKGWIYAASLLEAFETEAQQEAQKVAKAAKVRQAAIERLFFEKIKDADKLLEKVLSSEPKAQEAKN